jgi:hypothetical protein
VTSYRNRLSRGRPTRGPFKINLDKKNTASLYSFGIEKMNESISALEAVQTNTSPSSESVAYKFVMHDFESIFNDWLAVKGPKARVFCRLQGNTENTKAEAAD